MQTSARRRAAAGAALSLAALSCGSVPYRRKPEPMPGYTGSTYTPPPSKFEPAPPDPSELADKRAVAFRGNFFGFELGPPWNVFGAEPGRRDVKGGPDGLWLKIADGDKAWDAVSARTSRLKADGDFDLRGRYRDFSSTGNASCKLLVVDASRPRGEAAYVERIQIDGKNLLKFGGEVEGSLENWGFVETESTQGDLRLVREGSALRAFSRADERSAWVEFAPAQPAPKSLPQVVKFGMKLSVGEHKSAQVRWAELTIDGHLIHAE